VTVATPATTPKPLPRPEGLDIEFFEHCAKGRLCFQRCRSCGQWRHIPRLMCAACGSPEWEWSQSSGRGRIFSWTVTHQAMHPAFAADVPYVVALVELEEGVRMVTGLRGIEPAELALDLPVVVSFEDAGEGVLLPYFRPA
jgi:uncharacterized OB-fold protein